MRGPDDRNAHSRFLCSAGAGYPGWDKGDDARRLQLLADLVDELVNLDEIQAAHVSEAFRVIDGIERLRGYRARSLREKYIEARAVLPPEARGRLTDDEIRALSPEALLPLLIEAAVREARNRTEDG